MDYLVRKCHGCGTEYPLDYAQPCEVDYRDDWDFWCQRHRKPAGSQGCEDCAYLFEARHYFDPSALGAAFFVCWVAGQRQTVRQRVSDWLLDSGRDRVLAGKVREVERMETLAPDDQYALVVMLLHGDSILRWRGEIVDIDWLHTSSHDKLELLRSPIIAAALSLGLATWLSELQEEWRNMAAELSTADAEEVAFGLLFRQAAAHDLLTALRVAALVPRLHGVRSWETQSPDSVAKLAAKTGDSGFSLPAAARLKELFVTLVQGLREGILTIPDNRCFYECTLILAWRYEGRTLLENALFREALATHLRTNTDRRLLQALISGYFRDFAQEVPTFISTYATLIREYLTATSMQEFRAWQDRDAVWNLFAGVASPALCAPHLQINGSLEEALRSLGLAGSNLWGGFSAELLLAWINTGGSYTLTAWQTIRQWFEKAANPSFVHREHRWIDAVVLPWIDLRAPEAIRLAVSRYLADRFGEPTSTSPTWEQCQPQVRDTVKQWLFLGNLEKFFELITNYAETTGGEMHTHWAYRKAFWLAVHRTSAVSDLRVAVGDGILAAFGSAKLKDQFGSRLARINDTDEHRCALILQINDLTVVDFTHNAKCRIWRTGSRQARWFSQAKISRGEFRDHSDMLLRPHYTESGMSHFNSENYGWQDALAEFLRGHSVVRLSRRDYECHNHGGI